MIHPHPFPMTDVPIPEQLALLIFECSAELLTWSLLVLQHQDPQQASVHALADFATAQEYAERALARQRAMQESV